MPGRVYLIGAGFSRAISDKMPMMAGLSEAVKADLADFDLPGMDRPVSANFEQWLSYLIETTPWLGAVEQAANSAAFLRISRAVHKVMCRAQKEAVETQDECPAWLQELVSLWQRESATVITFNYDQLVELAWRIYAAPSSFGPDKPHLPRPWIDLYPIPITNVGRRVALVFGDSAPADGMKLLKLHGSLNWRYSGPDGAGSDPLYEMMGAESALGWNAQSLKPRDTDEAAAFDLVPMIVPPAAVKSPYYGNRMLSALWRRAAQALNAANELVLMGFSLPPTDLVVSSMLATELPLDSSVTPVDTNRDIVQRVQDAFVTRNYPRAITDDFAGDDNPIDRWVDAHGR